MKQEIELRESVNSEDLGELIAGFYNRYKERNRQRDNINVLRDNYNEIVDSMEMPWPEHVKWRSSQNELKIVSIGFKVWKEMERIKLDAITIELYLRFLQTVLALELYRLDHKVYPTEVSDLQPDYLDELPIDPFSNKPIVYKLIKDGFTIYSYGEDYDDDGGQNRKWDNIDGDQVFWPVEKNP